MAGLCVRGEHQPKNSRADNCPAVFVLNSFKISLHFSKEIFNVNVQASPFFDAALVHNREKNTLFSLKDGYYCAGLEILIYPLKWSSYTLRASFGFDIMNVLKSDSLIQGLLKHNEFFFGIGLQY